MTLYKYNRVSSGIVIAVSDSIIAADCLQLRANHLLPSYRERFGGD